MTLVSSLYYVHIIEPIKVQTNKQTNFGYYNIDYKILLIYFIDLLLMIKNLDKNRILYK
jgi:hypothetical protein